jgi:tight adherence protein C
MRRDSGQRQRQSAARTSPRVTLVTSLVLVPGALIFVIVGLYLGADVDLSQLFGG